MLLVLVTCAAIVSSVDSPGTTVSVDPAGAATGTASSGAASAGPAAVAFGAPATVTKDGEPLGTLVVDTPETAPSAFGGGITPDNGPVFVNFRVTITSQAAGPLTFNMFSFYVRNAAGERFQPTISREPSLSSGTLNPGETVSGWVTFDAGEHGTLVYAPSALIGASVAEWTF